MFTLPSFITFARQQFSWLFFLKQTELPDFNNAVITIGTFDGVHQGHRQILAEVVRHAQQLNGESIVITFEPHPRKLLFPEQSLKLLTPLQQKLELISTEGIRHIVVVPFTKEFSALSAQEYVHDFLVSKFHPQSIVIGYDHHFGHDRTGNIHLLQNLQQACNFEVVEIPAQLIDEAAVSSTKIRKALAAGQVSDAAQMLGRAYSICGTVVEGKKLGRTIGYPTANIQPRDEDQLIPAIGIYAVRVNYNGNRYKAMLSIGYNPTISDEKKLHIEAHIFDFNETIYGQQLEILFVKRLRDEEKFPDMQALKHQLSRDQLAAQDALG